MVWSASFNFLVQDYNVINNGMTWDFDPENLICENEDNFIDL